MDFSYFMPVRVIFGRDCVALNASLLRPFGKKALVVTGGSSAKNGALADVLSAIGEKRAKSCGVRRRRLQSLPRLRAGRAPRRRERPGAEFVVGIGGGSALDAAKAVAALARQPREGKEIFSGGWTEDVLP